MNDQAKRVDVINLVGEINMQMAYSFCTVAANIIQGYPQRPVRDQSDIVSPSEVEIHISSSGGDMNAALTIYNTIQMMQLCVKSLVTHNIGTVGSCAVLIYLAANIRRAALESNFLIHPVEVDGRKERISLFAVKGMQLLLNQNTTHYSRIFNERTKTQPPGISPAFDVMDVLTGVEDFRFDPATAVKLGVVTEALPGYPKRATNAIIWGLA